MRMLEQIFTCMKRLNESAVKKIYSTLIERFGEPIGAPPVTKKNKLSETRERVTKVDIMDAYEEMYVEAGPPNLEDLISWLGTTREAVMNAWPRWLVISSDGTVDYEDDVSMDEADDLDQVTSKGGEEIVKALNNKDEF